ncbi:MAG: hypothetical protein MRY72_13180 [Aquisalinus sp.]|nr:hypothetical protein [Aquisalinus sp.]
MKHVYRNFRQRCLGLLGWAVATAALFFMTSVAALADGPSFRVPVEVKSLHPGTEYFTIVCDVWHTPSGQRTQGSVRFSVPEDQRAYYKTEVVVPIQGVASTPLYEFDQYQCEMLPNLFSVRSVSAGMKNMNPAQLEAALLRPELLSVAESEILQNEDVLLFTGTVTTGNTEDSRTRVQTMTTPNAWIRSPQIIRTDPLYFQGIDLARDANGNAGLARLGDLGVLRFRVPLSVRSDGREKSPMTIACVVFDGNGNAFNGLTNVPLDQLGQADVERDVNVSVRFPWQAESIVALSKPVDYRCDLLETGDPAFQAWRATWDRLDTAWVTPLDVFVDQPAIDAPPCQMARRRTSCGVDRPQVSSRPPAAGVYRLELVGHPLVQQVKDDICPRRGLTDLDEPGFPSIFSESEEDRDERCPFSLAWGRISETEADVQIAYQAGTYEWLLEPNEDATYALKPYEWCRAETDCEANLTLIDANTVDIKVSTEDNTRWAFEKVGDGYRILGASGCYGGEPPCGLHLSIDEDLNLKVMRGTDLPATNIQWKLTSLR